MNVLRKSLRQLPGMWRFIAPPQIEFQHSSDYWIRRYESAGNSGAGSYGRLADFKAEILNDFVTRKQVDSVIELGVGDGHQLSLANYPRYIGLDIAPAALRHCISKFEGDQTKSFYLFDPSCSVDNAGLFCANTALSLDVIYHLIEDDVFEAYMRSLFSLSRQYVVIYASNDSMIQSDAQHVKHRCFTDWVGSRCPEWRLTDVVKNAFPFDTKRPGDTSFADFFFFEKT